ncbi:unnamed protein product [Amoebophrya sp. A25]|nr:unnamed protein product [Amoebophrya sp. A25]|eukprot:GSA25T00010960001.1
MREIHPYARSPPEGVLSGVEDNVDYKEGLAELPNQESYLDIQPVPGEEAAEDVSPGGSDPRGNTGKSSGSSGESGGGAGDENGLPPRPPVTKLSAQLPRRIEQGMMKMIRGTLYKDFKATNTQKFGEWLRDLDNLRPLEEMTIGKMRGDLAPAVDIFFGSSIFQPRSQVVGTSDVAGPKKTSYFSVFSSAQKHSAFDGEPLVLDMLGERVGAAVLQVIGAEFNERKDGETLMEKASNWAHDKVDTIKGVLGYNNKLKVVRFLKESTSPPPWSMVLRDIGSPLALLSTDRAMFNRDVLTVKFDDTDANELFAAFQKWTKLPSMKDRTRIEKGKTMEKPEDKDLTEFPLWNEDSDRASVKNVVVMLGHETSPQQTVLLRLMVAPNKMSIAYLSEGAEGSCLKPNVDVAELWKNWKAKKPWAYNESPTSKTHSEDRCDIRTSTVSQNKAGTWLKNEEARYLDDEVMKEIGPNPTELDANPPQDVDPKKDKQEKHEPASTTPSAAQPGPETSARSFLERGSGNSPEPNGGAVLNFGTEGFLAQQNETSFISMKMGAKPFDADFASDLHFMNATQTTGSEMVFLELELDQHQANFIKEVGTGLGAAASNTYHAAKNALGAVKDYILGNEKPIDESVLMSDVAEDLSQNLVDNLHFLLNGGLNNKPEDVENWFLNDAKGTDAAFEKMLGQLLIDDPAKIQIRFEPPKLGDDILGSSLVYPLPSEAAKKVSDKVSGFFRFDKIVSNRLAVLVLNEVVSPAWNHVDGKRKGEGGLFPVPFGHPDQDHKVLQKILKNKEDAEMKNKKKDIEQPAENAEKNNNMEAARKMDEGDNAASLDTKEEVGRVTIKELARPMSDVEAAWQKRTDKTKSATGLRRFTTQNYRIAFEMATGLSDKEIDDVLEFTKFETSSADAQNADGVVHAQPVWNYEKIGDGSDLQSELKRAVVFKVYLESDDAALPRVEVLRVVTTSVQLSIMYPEKLEPGMVQGFIHGVKKFFGKMETVPEKISLQDAWDRWLTTENPDTKQDEKRPRDKRIRVTTFRWREENAQLAGRGVDDKNEDRFRELSPQDKTHKPVLRPVGNWVCTEDILANPKKRGSFNLYGKNKREKPLVNGNTIANGHADGKENHLASFLQRGDSMDARGGAFRIANGSAATLVDQTLDETLLLVLSGFTVAFLLAFGVVWVAKTRMRAYQRLQEDGDGDCATLEVVVASTQQGASFSTN